MSGSLYGGVLWATLIFSLESRYSLNHLKWTNIIFILKKIDVLYWLLDAMHYISTEGKGCLIFLSLRGLSIKLEMTYIHMRSLQLKLKNATTKANKQKTETNVFGLPVSLAPH